MSDLYTQLKRSDLPEVREKLKEDQDNTCPICLRKFSSYVQPCVDHEHFGKGLVRGILCRNCNANEGRIWKRAKMCKGNLEGGELEWLINLVHYLVQEPTLMIHPDAAPKIKKVKKSSYKKMVKLFKLKYPKRKLPDYPTSGKLTIRLNQLFEEFRIKKFYYKD